MAQPARVYALWNASGFLHGMTVEVLADADTDIIILHLAEDQQGYQTFEKFGGLPNSAEYGANGTGDIKFTTTGAGAVGDAYQVIIRAVKNIDRGTTWQLREP